MNQAKKTAEVMRLRDAILLAIPSALETDDAEALTDALSFQSRSLSNRHIWIELAEDGISIDLEDWDAAGEWDNTVATIGVDSQEQAAELVRAWCLGKKLPVANFNPTSTLMPV